VGFLRIVSILLFFCLLGAISFADETDVIDLWRSVLEYGLDDQVAGIISEIQDSGEISLAPVILQRIIESKKDPLTMVAFEYFREIDYREAIDYAFELVETSSDSNPDMMRAVLLYIANQDKSVDPILDFLIGQLDTPVLGNYIAVVLGKKSNAMIIDRLDKEFWSNQATRNRRLIILDSFTQSSNQQAVGFLKKVIEEYSQDKDLVQVALIGLAVNTQEQGSSIFEIIEPYLTDSNELTRSNAFAALVHVSDEKTVTYYKQGLRDDSWRVRLQALEGIKQQSINTLQSAVSFTLRHDPVRRVQEKALEVTVSFDPRSAYQELSTQLQSNTRMRAAIAIELLKTNNANAMELVYPYITSLRQNSEELGYIAKRLPEITNKNMMPICLYFLESTSQALILSGIRTATNNGFVASLENVIEQHINERLPRVIQHEARVALQTLNR